MRNLGDGKVLLTKGERMPFMCPECGNAVVWQPKILFVSCESCGHYSDRVDFEAGEFEFACELEPDDMVVVVCPSCPRRFQIRFGDFNGYQCFCGWGDEEEETFTLVLQEVM